MAVATKPGPYHHGQLREVLLDAALELARERGLHGVSIREVARQAGVSHAAPYHHFADKAALVTALALRGFEQLAERLQAAADAAGGDDLDRLRAAGVAYVQFALSEPAAFRLMFRPELRDEEGMKRPSAALIEAGKSAYDVLLKLIAAGQASGRIRSGPPAELALTAWSTTHGLATLLLDGVPGLAVLGPMMPKDGHAIATQVATLILEGLRAPVTAAPG